MQSVILTDGCALSRLRSATDGCALSRLRSATDGCALSRLRSATDGCALSRLRFARARLESALGERISSPFTDLDRRVFESVPTGITSLDALTGGLPRGAITEIFGPPSSGRTSAMVSVLAEAIARNEVCALVDGNDAFDPKSAASAGVDLNRLLWVRCHNNRFKSTPADAADFGSNA